MVASSYYTYPSFVYIWLWKIAHPDFPQEHNVVHHNMPRTSWITVNGCVFPTQMTTTREADCLFKEQDTSTLVSWQACRTQSGLSGNYLSTRSQCFNTLSSLFQTSHPSSFADNDSGAVCSYCMGMRRWQRACWSMLFLITLFDNISCLRQHWLCFCLPLLLIKSTLHLSGMQSKTIYMKWGFLNWPQSSSSFLTLVNHRL